MKKLSTACLLSALLALGAGWVAPVDVAMAKQDKAAQGGGKGKSKGSEQSRGQGAGKSKGKSKSTLKEQKLNQYRRASARAS